MTGLTCVTSIMGSGWAQDLSRRTWLYRRIDHLDWIISPVL